MTPEQALGIRESTTNFSQAVSSMVSGGVEILAIQLLNRKDTYAGNSLIDKYTNQPHREWIYRQAYEVGRHVIGYELQTIFSILDLFDQKVVLCIVVRVSDGKRIERHSCGTNYKSGSHYQPIA